MMFIDVSKKRWEKVSQAKDVLLSLFSYL